MKTAAVNPNQAAELSSYRSIMLIRTSVIAVAILAASLATFWYVQALSGGAGMNFLHWASVPLFSVLFGWIAFSFCQACLGFCLMVSDLAPGVQTPEPETAGMSETLVSADAAPLAGSRPPTAILMPVYNESPTRVFAGIRAMIASLREHSRVDELNLQNFEFYILSDTTDTEIWLEEETAWAELVQQEPDAVVYYRHRPENLSRKAGNIADFCTRWGSKYPYMIILDADSLMSGQTMMEMVRRISADDALGILQVPPVPIGRKSLFARLQQFSAAAYGPMFLRGFDCLAGRDGNYWGHNAILRVDAFLKHCRLPVLPGAAPLGGEILSHDFVEAALMLKAGWKVQLATDLAGSYEECPTTLTDYAIRDQRWCQGNLQHSRLAISKGFAIASRWHFVFGIMAYAASPLWVLMMLLCVSGTVIGTDPTAPSSPSDHAAIAFWLFGISMTMLLLPKGMSLLLASVDARRRKSLGGGVRVWISGLIEVIASVLMSPIMALHHTRFVIGTLTGHSVRWSAQRRDEHGVSWCDAASDYLGFTIVGALVTVCLAHFYPELLGWFSPLLVGLVGAIPLAVWMGSGKIGKWLARWRLLMIPEESDPPAITIDHQRFIAASAAPSPAANRPSGFDTMLDAVIRDPKFFSLHRDIQMQAEVDRPLPTNQSKAIEAAWAAGGTKQIPEKLRGPLLNDLATMKALHIEAQISRAGVP